MIVDDIAGQMGFDVISLDAQPDHIHHFKSANSQPSITRIINMIRCTSSKRLIKVPSEIKETLHEPLWTYAWFAVYFPARR